MRAGRQGPLPRDAVCAGRSSAVRCSRSMPSMSRSRACAIARASRCRAKSACNGGATCSTASARGEAARQSGRGGADRDGRAFSTAARPAARSDRGACVRSLRRSDADVRCAAKAICAIRRRRCSICAARICGGPAEYASERAGLAYGITALAAFVRAACLAAAAFRSGRVSRSTAPRREHLCRASTSWPRPMHWQCCARGRASISRRSRSAAAAVPAARDAGLPAGRARARLSRGDGARRTTTRSGRPWRFRSGAVSGRCGGRRGAIRGRCVSLLRRGIGDHRLARSRARP